MKPLYAWISVGLTFLFFAVTLAGFSEMEALWMSAGGTFFLSLVLLFYVYRRNLKGRQAAYGLQSFVTVLLVVGILGVVNFLGTRYPKKFDLTKNRLHTLSDQTEKVLKGLTQPLKLNYFAALEQKEELRGFFDNVKALNPKIELEVIDPNKEPTRAKQAQVRAYGTLQIVYGSKDTKIETVNEEKFTNAIIKLTKDRVDYICPISGHGEIDFDSNQAQGYQAVKALLQNQAYEFKPLALLQEGKVPEVCGVVVTLGPSKPYLPQEVQLLRDYLTKGGRWVLSVDGLIEAKDPHAELLALAKEYGVESRVALVLDPASRLFNSEPTVAIVTAYDKEHPVTKEMQGNTLFPMSRPLGLVKPLPEGFQGTALLKSLEQAWGETDFAALKKGKVDRDPKADVMGPLELGVAVSGKKKDSPRETRIVVFGSSGFADNRNGRYGNGFDLYANAVSWALEDESMISIRARDDEGGRVELSQRTGSLIGLTTVFLMPLLTAILGIVIWVRRKRL
jgi:ABC-type uncharacterized transport system involved in gliding motility auxiliary subunit